MKPHFRMEKIVAGLVAFALWSSAARAENPCDEHYETNNACHKSKIVPLPITPNPFPICPGGTVTNCNSFTNEPGKQVIWLVRASCARKRVEVNWFQWSWITNEWWEATGAINTNGTGHCAAFSVPKVAPGSTTLKFYLTYTNSTPCGVGPYTITNTVTLTIVDSDADGLPDCWEMEHFGDLDETAGGNPDSDALTNLQEYLHGTDPDHNDATPNADNIISLQVYTPLN